MMDTKCPSAAQGNESLLEQAITLARAGDKAAARKILRRIVAGDPNDENAWGWLAACAETKLERRQALERILEINPGNEPVRRALEKMTGGSQSAPRSASPEPAPPAKIQSAAVEPVKKKGSCSRTSVTIVIILFILGAIGSLVSDDDQEKDPGPTGPQKTERAEPLDAWSICKQYVKTFIDTPSTVKFPPYADATIWKDEDNWRVSATFDAENLFGAEVRYYFICVVHRTGDKWRLVNLEID